MKVYELADLNVKQITRIVDYFSLGKIVTYKILDNSKFYIETNNGSFLLKSIISDEWHNLPVSITDNYKFSKYLRKLFSIKHGKVLLNGSRNKVNLTHKYGKYYFCVEL